MKNKLFDIISGIVSGFFHIIGIIIITSVFTILLIIAKTIEQYIVIAIITPIFILIIFIIIINLFEIFKKI